VGRGNRQDPAIRSFRVTHIFGEYLLEFGRLVGISGARVNRVSHRSRGEGTLGLVLHAGEIIVFQKPRAAKRFFEMLHQAADVEIAGRANQERSQLQLALNPVKEFQARHQPGRNDERRVREMERVANHQPRAILDRGRHEV
jgi:hypothetical protein